MSELRSNTIRAADPLLYLFGHRGAIERIAATPWAWIIGVVLVLSAGIARNYDHLDLLRDPEWIWGPFAASLVSTSFIYFWLLIVLRSRKGLEGEEAPQSGRSLLTFLNLVWMTAPCAWIYGIPVESCTDLLTATKWNIGFLAVVSVWRVVLITRAATVLSGAPWLRVFLFVLTPAAFEMWVGSLYQNFNRSLLVSMGGVQMPPHDELLMKASEVTLMISAWTFFIGFVVMFLLRGPAKKPLCRPAAGFPRGALVLALASLALWVMAAVPMHHGVSNRHAMERLIEDQEYAAAIQFAASKQRSDFSGMHYLPPDPMKYALTEHMMMLRCLDEKSPEWLRQEMIANAVEACKLQKGLEGVVLQVIRDDFPEVDERLGAYAESLKAKPKRTKDEERWLQSFSAPHQ